MNDIITAFEELEDILYDIKYMTENFQPFSVFVYFVLSLALFFIVLAYVKTLDIRNETIKIKEELEKQKLETQNKLLEIELLNKEITKNLLKIENQNDILVLLNKNNKDKNE